MSYSKLTNKYIPASTANYSKGRAGKKVTKITPHHMAGNLSIEACGKLWQNPSRRASSNYGIDSDGRIACYVDEENRSWCSSSAANDNQAITVEIANDGGAPNWHVSDKAVTSFVNLAIDICKRYGIKSINYTGNANGNMTEHRYFIATLCPGPYLHGLMPTIAKRINDGLGKPTPTPTPTDKFLPAKGYWGPGDNDKHVGQIATFMRRNFPAYTPKAALGNQYGPNLTKAIKEFQRRTNMSKVDQDGCVGPKTLAKLRSYGFPY